MGRGGDAVRAREVAGARLPDTRGTRARIRFQSARRYQTKPLGHQALTSDYGRRTGFLGLESPPRGGWNKIGGSKRPGSLPAVSRVASVLNYPARVSPSRSGNVSAQFLRQRRDAGRRLGGFCVAGGGGKGTAQSSLLSLRLHWAG